MRVRAWTGLLLAIVLVACKTAERDQGNLDSVARDEISRMQRGYVHSEVAAVAPPSIVSGKIPTLIQRQWYAVESTTLTHCDFMLYAKKHGVSYMEGRRQMGDQLLRGARNFIDDIISFAGTSQVDLSSVQLNSDNGHSIAFSDHAIRECESYLPAIQNSVWSCAQWYVADYITYLWKSVTFGQPSDAVKARINRLPFDIANIPFMKVNTFAKGVTRTDAALQEKIAKAAGLLKDDPGTYLIVSNRTFKAYSGMMNAAKADAELEKLAADAKAFFQEAPFNGQWQGYPDKDFNSDETIYYCSGLKD